MKRIKILKKLFPSKVVIKYHATALKHKAIEQGNIIKRLISGYINKPQIKDLRAKWAPFVVLLKQTSILAYEVTKVKIEQYIAELNSDMNNGAKLAKKYGFMTVAGLFLFFIVWGCFAPLEGAVVAEGSVVVDTNKRTVQHLEGGIIKQILVKNGDIVAQGQELIILQDQTVQSKYQLLAWRLLVEKAAQARLIAERDGLSEITYDKEILDRQADPEMKQILDVQNNLFKVRQDSIKQNVNILEQRISQLEKQIAGLESQKKSGLEQISLIREELETAQTLLDKGLEQKPRVLALRRTAAELDGRIGEYEASIAKSNDAINETKLQILNITTERQRDTANEIKETENRIAGVQEELIGAKDVYERTVITASRSGVVTNLHYHTIGGVITPGAPIMDIVPTNDELVVEAKLQTNAIESVHKGQEARVLLAAYKVRFIPRLKGEVIDVSPDRMMDEVTHQPYYSVRVKIDKKEIESFKHKLELYPGMPTQVFIVTDSATFMQYMLYPFRATLRKAFIESSKIE